MESNVKNIKTEKRYEARLIWNQWTTGSGWYLGGKGDTIESWDATENLDWWKEAFAKKDYSNLFEYIDPGYEESEDYDGVKYTMELVEIDADDDFDEGKQIAKLSIWGSELRDMREAN